MQAGHPCESAHVSLLEKLYVGKIEKISVLAGSCFVLPYFSLW